MLGRKEVRVRDVTGSFSMPSDDDNKIKVKNFCVEKNLCVGNTRPSTSTHEMVKGERINVRV